MIEVITSSATIVNPQVTGALNNLLSTAFQTTLLLLVAGLTWGVKMGLSTIKNSLIRSFASRAVAFAAQRLTSLSDDEKRKEVAVKIHKKFPRLGEDEVNHFLEEAYVNLQAGLKAANA